MMKEWISIFDDMPQIQKRLKYCTVDVRCRTEKGREFIGFYHEEQADWFEQTASGYKRVREEVTQWQIL